MRPHVIVGRFGPGDRAAIPTALGEASTKLDLVVSKRALGHGIGRALSDLRKLKLVPTEVALDLLVLAAHIHAADTRVSRSTESQDSWTRELRLVVPVSDPARWIGAAPTLRRILNFLSGDRWIVDFRARPAKFRQYLAPLAAELIPPPYDSVNLFSGGLDSLIGAIDALEGGGQPLFASHAGEGAVSKSQEDCFDVLQKHYAKLSPTRFRLWMNFPKNLVRKVGSEDSTRARSFLFFALGVFAGSSFGKPFKLRVPENGLISLNVPLDTLRLGSLSTRTTHPFYIARWNQLLHLLGIPGVIENPYWNKTKGEMVSECTNTKLLHGLVPSSMSCSSPTKGRWKGLATEHCGFCLPCLIRRGALLSIGDPTTYTVLDLRASEMDTRRAEGKQIRSFQYAIERLRARPQLAKMLIHKPGPLFDELARLDALADVYTRGLNEVGVLLDGVRAGPS
ncbi:hypothetical protein ABIF14_008815 [Bradyrhizobium elkanii]|uniref:Qat anti-phage system QueC-like protein QatC n=1 Tax=Bradyrhizobium elkanii TaxID=29448 RepID=UPI003510DE0E